MKIVYMGTPDFAVPALKYLAGTRHRVVAVVTGHDKPVGRGQVLAPTPVKVAAQELGIPTLTPVSLRDPEFLAQLRQFDADIFVVIAFRILPLEVFVLPRYGAINAHASLLPKYRGAAPIQWALMNGETETGLTTFVIRKNIDTGSVILKEATPIRPHDTYTSLAERLAAMAGSVVERSLDALERGVALTPQDDTKATPAPKITPSLCVIDWTKTAQTVVNRIRGLAHSPGAVCGFRGERLKIFEAEVATDSPSNLASGEIAVTKDRIIVGCGQGAIALLSLQPAGKRIMSAADFVNGYKPQAKEIVGAA